MIAMILAAGRGERMLPLTDSLPKALLEVDGVSLIERHLAMLADAGAHKVIVNLGWLGEQIVERVGDGSRYGVQIVFSPEDDNVLETGGGIRRALPLLGDDPFWVVNSDVYTDLTLPAPALEPGCVGHLVMVPIPAHKRRGDFDLRDGRVRNGDVPAWTFSGIGCYSKALFPEHLTGRFPLAPLLREAADRGRLSGSVYEGAWEDVGTPERLSDINRRVSMRK